MYTNTLQSNVTILFFDAELVTVPRICFGSRGSIEDRQQDNQARQPLLETRISPT